MRAVTHWVKAIVWDERWGRGWFSAALLVALGTVVRLPQLSHTLAEAHAFRQTQTATVVREYFRNGIDLATTPLPVFGTHANVPMELPLFQALASALSHLGLEASVAARLTGLVAFQVAAVLLFVLVRRWHGALAALATLGLFQFTPFAMQWGAASLIDFFAVASALATVLWLDTWLHSGRRISLVLAVGAAIVAFLVKSTTAPAWVILIAVSAARLVHRQGWAASWRRITVSAVAPAAGLVAAWLWTAQADRIKESQPLTGFLTSDALVEWNFGTVAQRLSTATWTTIADRVTDTITGAGILAIALAAVVLWTRRSVLEAIALAGWVAVAVVPLLVFTNLYYVHSYYLIAAYPALVAAVAVGLAVVARQVGPTVVRQRVALAVGSLVVLTTSAVSATGLASLSAYRHNAAIPALAVAMRAESAPEDRWIMVGCDWDPVYLFYADREGVMFRSDSASGFWESEPDPEQYTRLAVCSGEPPLERYVPPGSMLRPVSGPHALFVVEH